MRFGVVLERFVPPPTVVLDRVVELLGQESFLRDVIASVLAWMIALGIAIAIAVPAGLVLGSVPGLRIATRAIVEFLRRVCREHGCTVLLVTHDIDESVYLGDRVLVLSRAPATILADLPVNLPAARDQIAIRQSAEFVFLGTSSLPRWPQGS